MKRIKILLTLIFLVLFSGSLFAGDKLPKVVILATGGTIAGTAESGTQAGYTSGQLGIKAMIDAVPGIRKVADVSGEQLSNVGSQDMSVEIWLKTGAALQ